MARLFWICVGGAAGTAARYFLGGWLLGLLGTSFPWGTLAVNLLGSILVGAVMHVSLATDLIGPTLRLALTTGFLGGFTTYSAFNYETVRYLRDGAYYLGVLNFGVMSLACLLGGFLGVALAQAWVR
ncbi:MAG TPA: fluoride efflux transporter CrcB [Thermoanaerobaculia bacterium]|nr:fluoride efflux transporter CrcB [Thermoanaerobaculia bacterium]